MNPWMRTAGVGLALSTGLLLGCDGAAAPSVPENAHAAANAYEFATVVDNTGLTTRQYTARPVTDHPPQSPGWVAFMRLNHDRVRCGFGGLSSNRLLDRAAQAHAWYLIHNNRPSDGHSESAPDLPYFSGAGPKERVLAAGYKPSWLGEELVTFSGYQERSLQVQALSAVKSLMMAPYHMVGVFGGFREIGIHVTNSAMVGAKTGGLAATNLVLGIPMTTPTTLVQQRRTGEVVTYPCEGIDDTATALFNEMPNPFPGRDLSKDPVGQPVLVQANEGSTVNISQASYREKTTGVALPLSILAGQVDASLPKFNSHQVFVVPMQALKGNTEYQVNLVGTVTTVVNNQQSVQPFVRDFSFKTGAKNDF